MRSGHACVWALAAAIASAPALAAEPALESARECGRLVAEAERLACYDALFREPDAASATPAAQDEHFGLTERDREARKREQGMPAIPEELTSKVVRVTTRRPNPPVIDLENGQTWRLLEVSDFTAFRVGDVIVIRRGAFGSYLASAEGRAGAWRVRRVQ